MKIEETSDDAIREMYEWWKVWNSLESKGDLLKRHKISVARLNTLFAIFDEISAPTLRELRVAWEKRTAVKTQEEIMEQYDLSKAELANLMGRFTRYHAGLQ